MRVWGYRTSSLEIPEFNLLLLSYIVSVPRIIQMRHSNVTVQNFSDLLRKKLQHFPSISLFDQVEHNCANDFLMHQFTFSIFSSDCSPAYEISHMKIKFKFLRITSLRMNSFFPKFCYTKKSKKNLSIWKDSRNISLQWLALLNNYKFNSNKANKLAAVVTSLQGWTLWPSCGLKRHLNCSPNSCQHFSSIEILIKSIVQYWYWS